MMEVVQEARKWLGVPWRHQGRDHNGIDCAGLIIKVAHGLGISSFDCSGYGLTPDGESLRAELERHVDAKPARIGSIVLLRFISAPQHLAILTDIGLIHAYARAGRVIETSFDERWRRRVVGFYRYRWPR